MKRLIKWFAVLSAMTAIVAAAACPCLAAGQDSLVLGKMSLGKLKQQLNKSATFDGVYFDGSVPMIVDSLETALADTPLPPGKFVPLAGKLAGVASGDKVRLAGMVRKQAKATSGDALELSVPASGVSKLAASASALRVGMVAATTPTPPPSQPTKFALLVGGGKDAYNNYYRYWNDIRWTYYYLRYKGYPAANIYVLYANGARPTPDVPVRAGANMGALAGVIGTIAARMTTQSNLFVGFYGQGDRIADANHDEINAAYGDAVFYLWNHFKLTDDALKVQINRITRHHRMIIQLNQAFSGGFVDELSAPRRVIYASSQPTQLAYSHPSGAFGNLNYWVLSCYHKHQLIGGAAVNADANGNGQLSIVEVYNYSRPRVAPQILLYDDNGLKPGHTGPMPGAGEGALGLNTYL